MKEKCLHKIAEYAFALFIVLTFFGAFLSVPLHAQDANSFSGSDINQYNCYDTPTVSCTGPIDSGSTSDCPGVPAGRYVCVCEDEDGNIQCSNAIPSPPSLRVVEYWFVKVLYVIWAFSGIAFTFILIFLGFRYMTSLGEEAVLQDVVKRVRYWFIGILLVFLSYPILNTVFNAIGISESECFNEIQMPAFQIFFPNSCQP